jgi:hypothetical protein
VPQGSDGTCPEIRGALVRLRPSMASRNAPRTGIRETAAAGSKDLASRIPAVLHAEDIERFRRMTPEERIRLGLDLANLGWLFLERLSPEERQRRIDLMKRQPWRPPPGPMEE